MRLLFKSPAIAAVLLAGTSDGWPKAEVERGSGKIPARLGLEPVRPAPTCMVNGVETAFVDCTGDGADCKQKCLEACDGVEGCSCCVGGNACDGFQGKVCPDGSCSGFLACFEATIGYVVDGCQGADACYYAGNNGDLGSVVSSCNNVRACLYAALGGEIQEITSSCNADRACQNAAMYGHIEGLSLSCNADRACHSAASDGTIPNKMEGCCNSASACGHLAEDYHQDPGPDPDAEGEPLRPVQQDPDPDQCEAPLSSSPTKVPAEVPTMRPVSESNVEDEGSLDEISSMKSETSADAGIPLD